MLLERRLVKILDSYIVYKGETNRCDFINYVSKSKLWPRINYSLIYREDMFIRKINNIVDDCIKYKFIEEKNGNIKVTEEGRDYIKIIGFFEAFLKRRKRTVSRAIEVIFSAVVGFLFGIFSKL